MLASGFSSYPDQPVKVLVERLAGCNMSYRRQVLRYMMYEDTEPIGVFQGLIQKRHFIRVLEAGYANDLGIDMVDQVENYEGFLREVVSYVLHDLAAYALESRVSSPVLQSYGPEIVLLQCRGAHISATPSQGKS